MRRIGVLIYIVWIMGGILPMVGQNKAQKATDYVGTMVVGDGSYTMKEVRVALAANGDMTMYNVKFARLMPFRVDVVIPGVTLMPEEDGKRASEVESWRLSGEGIVPTISGKPYPSRIATQMQGTATDKQLQFSVLFGGKKLQYSGQHK